MSLTNNIRNTVMTAVLLVLSQPGHCQSIEELEARVDTLKRALGQAEKELAEARDSGVLLPTKAVTTDGAEESTPTTNGVRLGPITLGGAVRVNYVYGDYETQDGGPSRGGEGGNVELDTFRINATLDYENLIGALEYRWYTANAGENYNFLHTGWLGYRFDDNSEVIVGLNRVPFGAGPYGISQSWFFDQHYYVGLSDDPDLGLRYSFSHSEWAFDIGYYWRSDPSFSGRSEDSARYGYDTVRWRETVESGGTVSFDDRRNGYREKNQFNARAITEIGGDRWRHRVGASLQVGELDGSGVDDGDHRAVAVHSVSERDNLTVGLQLSRYQFDVDADNSWGGDELIPFGAYDFAWPMASDAWVPAASISYRIDTPTLPWLDYVLPYLEYSAIVKGADNFNDSELFILGSGWAAGGWYIYTDLAYSNGNLFVGNRSDDFARIDGVGDWGINGNDRWNYRLNVNLGYYY